MEQLGLQEVLLRKRHAHRGERQRHAVLAIGRHMHRTKPPAVQCRCHLGSTSITANSGGGFSSELRYKPYGETRYTNGTTPTRHQFTGQITDTYINLYEMGVRQYDPEIGRWLSPDSIVPDPDSPQQFNRFSYVNNNPLRSKDSTGFCADTDTACIALVAKIKSLYGIDLVDRTEIWTWATADSIFTGLAEIAQKFTSIAGLNDATSQMKDLFQGATFYRDKEVKLNGESVLALTSAGSVSFSDLWAGLPEIGRRFYMAHEMGHLWDSRDTLFHVFGGMSSDLPGAVGSYWDYSDLLHPKYQLGDDFPQFPGRHRDDNEAEDWAESFASVTIPEYDNRNIGNKREIYVRAQISLWVKGFYGSIWAFLPH